MSQLKQIQKLCEEFNRPVLIDILVGMLTEKQLDFFGRIYPKQSYKHADKYDTVLRQLTNTLKQGNEDLEELKYKVDEQAETIQSLQKENAKVHNQKEEAVHELENLQDRMSARVMSKEEMQSESVTERLNLLDALEAGGVDNWSGYDWAREEAGII